MRSQPAAAQRMVTPAEQGATTETGVPLLAISDGRAGNLRQALALAQALDPGAAALELAPRVPWRWVAPRRLPAAGIAFGADFSQALHRPPPLAVGCGRQAALATRLLRARGSAVVQILDPRIDPAHWDLVVAPEHDGLRGPNVLTVTGSLHPVDPDWLQRARDDFAWMQALPAPRTALLLGGTSRHYRFNAAALAALIDRIAPALAAGSVLATLSRRSPPELREALAARLADRTGLLWDGSQLLPLGGTCLPQGVQANPYPGLLAWADRIVCSPDSVNMVSEACATSAPVFVFDQAQANGGPRRFLETLLAHGRIRPADHSLMPFTAEPLRETARVAAEVRARLGLTR